MSKAKNEQIKDNIRDFRMYFRDNYERFNNMRKFVWESSLSETDIQVNRELGKPTLEFPILPAHVARQRGEFSMQEPSIEVGSENSTKSVDLRLMSFIEGNLREILFESNRDNMAYNVFTDQLTGGFSAIKVYTEYAHEKSMDQNIRLRRCYDPTLVGFDKLAQESHKGDGKYCFELFPRRKEDFEAEYGTKYTKDMKFTRDIEGFSWSYRTGNDDILLMGDYYEKSRFYEKIVKLSDGSIMSEDDYELMIASWLEIVAPPVVVKSRKAEMIRIVRYLVTETGIIERPEKTDYEYLPLIFVDGDSMMMRSSTMGSAYQFAKPYVYHAVGAQKLKNYAGNTWANELENMVQHKFTVAKEAIPEQYKDAYINVQKASLLVYNGFYNNNPNIALNGPQPVPRVPMPPEVAEAFTMSDSMVQSILGNYDAQIGDVSTQASGRAIHNMAMQSNNASRPYIVSYMKALNQAALICLDLMPKYYTGKRSVQIKDVSGKRSAVMINDDQDPNSLMMDFDPKDINIKVEAGVSFQMQQQHAYESMINLMHVSPVINAFMSEEEGVKVLLDNIDMRGIDALKQGMPPFMQKQQAKQQQMQQMQMQLNPEITKQKQLALDAQKIQSQATIDAAKVGVAKQEADTKQILALAQIGQGADQHDLEAARIDAEQARTSVEMLSQLADMDHGHKMDILSLHHDNEHKREEREIKKTTAKAKKVTKESSASD